MYKFKHAVREETGNNWSRAISALLKEPLPAHVRHEGKNSHGDWFKINLPAGVWALVVTSDAGVTAGIYHSPALLERELKEALYGSPIKING